MIKNPLATIFVMHSIPERIPESSNTAYDRSLAFRSR